MRDIHLSEPIIELNPGQPGKDGLICILKALLIFQEGCVRHCEQCVQLRALQGGLSHDRDRETTAASTWA